MNQRKTKKYMGYSGLLVILLIAIDQFTKWLAYIHLYQKPDVSVIDGVFQLKYLENDSAAFSLDPVSILQRIFHFTYFDLSLIHISEPTRLSTDHRCACFTGYCVSTNSIEPPFSSAEYHSRRNLCRGGRKPD